MFNAGSLGSTKFSEFPKFFNWTCNFFREQQLAPDGTLAKTDPLRGKYILGRIYTTSAAKGLQREVGPLKMLVENSPEEAGHGQNISVAHQ
jgi:hypothetical protein